MLASFIQRRLSQRSTSPWKVVTLEAGAGGDCLFHSVAAGLEAMLQSNTPAAQLVLQTFQVHDFTQGKPHIVQRLRNCVAAGIRNLGDEDQLENMVTYINWRRSGYWQDLWDPEDFLHRHGFSQLLHATTIEAVGIDPQNEANLLVTYRHRQNLLHTAIENGAVNLALLREDLSEKFTQMGNYHWGSQQDVVMLSEALGIGFIVFTSIEQGNDQWIQYLNFQRSDYEFWMLLYWQDPIHYRLLQLRTSNHGRLQCFYHRSEIPDVLVQHFNLCNRSSPIGLQASVGVS